jgi:antirestriction protein ArdC
MDRNHCTRGVADRADIYTRITQEIVAAIEAGTHADCWKLPWHHDGGDVARPLNLASRKRYRGINMLALWIAAMKSGYASGVWGTYRQFASAGGQVRKGERATTVVFWKQFQRGDAEDGSGQGRGSDRDRGDAPDGAHGRARFMARGYHVFNLAQVDGLELPPQPALPEEQRVAAAERFFASLGIVIRTDGDQACYVPSLDVVRMPPFARFRSAEAFYATTAHECAHASGHPARLDRKLDTRFGSKAYAAEEAIALSGQSAPTQFVINRSCKPRALMSTKLAFATARVWRWPACKDISREFAEASMQGQVGVRGRDRCQDLCQLSNRIHASRCRSVGMRLGALPSFLSSSAMAFSTTGRLIASSSICR